MITSRSISLFQNVTETKNGKEIPIDLFFDNIKDGRWQDYVLPIRAMHNEADRESAKKRVPLVTLSGTFSERSDKQLKGHSGFIGVDIDDVDDPEKAKASITGDRHIYAAFTSISGKGLCLVFKINGDKHRELYAGISEYLATKYQLVADAKCVNVSRARFISFDPFIYINERADKFTYIPKSKPIKQVPNVVFVHSDFEMIINEITSKRVDLTDDYAAWLRVGFALADKFGENGRGYFHLISQFNPKYDSRLCDRQYNACTKAGKQGVTIATLYYMAKQAGINTMSEKTKIVSQAAYHAKKGRRSKDDTIKLLQDAEGINEEESADIVNQVYDNNITVSSSDNEIEALEQWIKQNYSLRRNSVSMSIENHGVPMLTKDFNTVWIAAKKIFEKVPYEMVERLINSDFTKDYNPIIDFFETNKNRKPAGVIRKFFDTIESDTGMGDGDFFPDYAYYFGSKWLIGLISSIHGKHCPLMLVLSGSKQGTGKTEFFRRLLPDELKCYYAESKLDKEIDGEILMTQKLIIMDDEMGGKNKKESSRLKELLSKQIFSLREPYGRKNVDLRRMAMLCGTTNHSSILNDPTGNRRIIPINVISISQEAYNEIDKTDLLIEAYQMYKAGESWELTNDDIKRLNKSTGEFEEASAEYELISKYFSLPSSQEKNLGNRFMTATDIKVYLEMKSMQKLNAMKIGQELARFGWEKKKVSVSEKRVWGYYVIEKLSEQPSFFGNT